MLAQASQVIILDNVRQQDRGRSKPITNTVLEGLVTADRYSLRRLGSNDMIEGPNHPLLLLTINDGQFGPDLARRIVWSTLHFDGDPGERPRSPIGAPDAWAAEHREAILGELLGLVRRWQEAGCPEGSARNGNFDKWTRTLGGILEVAGVAGFLADHDADRVARTEQDEGLLALAAARPGEYLDAKQWVELARSLEVLPEVTGREGRGAASSAMTKRLRAAVGRVVRGEDESGWPRRWRLVVGDAGRAKTFAFVEEDTNTASTPPDRPDATRRTEEDEGPTGSRCELNSQLATNSQDNSHDESPCFHEGSVDPCEFNELISTPEDTEEHRREDTTTHTRKEDGDSTRRTRSENRIPNENKGFRHASCPASWVAATRINSQLAAGPADIDDLLKRLRPPGSTDGGDLLAID